MGYNLEYKNELLSSETVVHLDVVQLQLHPLSRKLRRRDQLDWNASARSIHGTDYLCCPAVEFRTRTQPMEQHTQATRKLWLAPGRCPHRSRKEIARHHQRAGLTHASIISMVSSMHGERSLEDVGAMACDELVLHSPGQRENAQSNRSTSAEQ